MGDRIAGKRDLRRVTRQAALALSPEYRAEAEGRIAALLLSLDDYRTAGTVCCFVSAPWEIDTLPILDDVLRSGKRLCVPLCVERGRMEMRYVTDLSALSPGPMGILEPPSDAAPADPDDIDLLLVPCLASDHRGRRLGQGGGYYDRFLSIYPGTALLLCREALIRDDVPMEPHDIPVPYVLTERGLFEDGVPIQRN